MPEYVYGCSEDKEHPRVICSHGMMDHVYMWCYECNAKMKRVPQRLAVNWNGLKPSEGELTPEIKRVIEDAPRRRDQMTPHKSERLAQLEKSING